MKATSNSGPWSRFWTDGYTWCFDDDSDALAGKFVQDNDGKFSVTFNATDGAGHGVEDPLNFPTYRPALDAFLGRCLAGAVPAAAGRAG